jgi:hypothetical protein
LIDLFRRTVKPGRAKAPRRPRPQTVDAEAAIDIGGRLVPMRLRVNRRARRLIVRVDPSGRVLVTAPSQRAAGEAVAFARSRALWIREQLDAVGPLPFADGVTIPFRGRPHKIIHRAGARGVALASLDGEDALIVGGENAHLNRRVVDWLKREARLALAESVDRHIEAIGVPRRRIVIRDTTSRWGSCSSHGGLSFSWRLILAPPEILDYVAAHECAHLVHMDHSPRFWRLVQRLGVDAEASRCWFAAHGPALHRWGRVASVR